MGAGGGRDEAAAVRGDVFVKRLKQNSAANAMQVKERKGKADERDVPTMIRALGLNPKARLAEEKAEKSRPHLLFAAAGDKLMLGT